MGPVNEILNFLFPTILPTSILKMYFYQYPSPLGQRILRIHQACKKDSEKTTFNVLQCEYSDSGSDISVDTDLSPSKMGSNTDLWPSAVSPYWTPFSQDFGPYSPICPRQSHRISPMFANYIPIYYKITWISYYGVQLFHFSGNS